MNMIFLFINLLCFEFKLSNLKFGGQHKTSTINPWWVQDIKLDYGIRNLSGSPLKMGYVHCSIFDVDSSQYNVMYSTLVKLIPFKRVPDPFI